MSDENQDLEHGNDSEVQDQKGSGDLERQVYLEERKLLIDAEGEASQSLDKALITLSAGAFGLSLAFIAQVAPKPTTLWSLYVAWGGFVVSLLAVLLSFLFSQFAIARARDILDAYQNRETESTDNNNVWDTWTGALNYVSIGSFVLGVIMLAWFALRNLT